jgi:hypothetical protein
MKTRIVEAENVDAGGINWGKFMVGQFTDDEWARRSAVDGYPLVAGRGWRKQHLFVFDLQTGEGALFLPGGSPSADLNKHAIWVCPLFEPFLTWLYGRWEGSLDDLPHLVKIPSAAGGLSGYRRPGHGRKLKAETSTEEAAQAVAAEPTGPKPVHAPEQNAGSVSL